MMVVVSLQICKYERDFVGSNGMAVDEVPGEEGREAKSQPGELAQRLVAEDLTALSSVSSAASRASAGLARSPSR